ncbi:ATP-binding protein [Deinococcus petrolearius]|uniref:ATP-binding protein n=1 Tax=Deinococcus petrolearius TaxID=1751295 RepID=A0ABW1DNR4_9DEIO
MIEAMRALGYSLQSAIADIMDNSISANAQRIEVTMDWREAAAFVSVLDNGLGMDRATLINAMRPGSRNPLDARSPGDLGRFGMGLKTASFSQCRCLTVATRTAGGPLEVRRWDLDHVAATGEWQLLHGFQPGSEHHADRLTEMTHGTLVLWERLDRLTGAVGDDAGAQLRARMQFLNGVRKVEQHLGMIFHRFLSVRGKRARRMLLNGHPVAPWDPMLSERETIEQMPEEWLWLDGQAIRVQGTVLPHHSRLESEALREVEGPRGWNSQQGFHVYRDGRLLVAGGWLGLGLERDDRFRLARIRIDLPSTIDQQWGVDIRKSRVTVPPSLRGDLKRIAELTRDRALRVYRHRARLLTPRRGEEVQGLWNVRATSNGYRHEIDRAHPLVQALQGIPGARSALDALLQLIEETLPVERIWLTEATRDQVATLSDGDQQALQILMGKVYAVLVASGYSNQDALLQARGMDPFCHHPDLMPLFPPMEL